MRYLGFCAATAAVVFGLCLPSGTVSAQAPGPFVIPACDVIAAGEALGTAAKGELAGLKIASAAARGYALTLRETRPKTGTLGPKLDALALAAESAGKAALAATRAGKDAIPLAKAGAEKIAAAGLALTSDKGFAGCDPAAWAKVADAAAPSSTPEAPTATAAPTALSNEAAAPAAGGSQAPQGDACPADAPIKGNINSKGDKIYHTTKSRSYGVTKPEACFTTEADAVADGFRAPLR